MEYRLCFDQLQWEQPAPGVQQKVFSDGTQRLRLLRFDDQFVEPEWCLKGHWGYILQGELTIDFAGEIKQFRAGDGLWIPPGPDSKHKVVMPPGQSAELIVFEK